MYFFFLKKGLHSMWYFKNPHSDFVSYSSSFNDTDKTEIKRFHLSLKNTKVSVCVFLLCFFLVHFLKQRGIQLKLITACKISMNVFQNCKQTFVLYDWRLHRNPKQFRCCLLSDPVSQICSSYVSAVCSLTCVEKQSHCFLPFWLRDGYFFFLKKTQHSWRHQTSNSGQTVVLHKFCGNCKWVQLVYGKACLLCWLY